MLYISRMLTHIKTHMHLHTFVCILNRFMQIQSAHSHTESTGWIHIHSKVIIIITNLSKNQLRKHYFSGATCTRRLGQWAVGRCGFELSRCWWRGGGSYETEWQTWLSLIVLKLFLCVPQSASSRKLTEFWTERIKSILRIDTRCLTCRWTVSSVLTNHRVSDSWDFTVSLSIQAVLHESLRMASTLPLSLFHCTTKDTEVLGYSIPKVSSVIFIRTL